MTKTFRNLRRDTVESFNKILKLKKEKPKVYKHAVVRGAMNISKRKTGRFSTAMTGGKKVNEDNDKQQIKLSDVKKIVNDAMKKKEEPTKRVIPRRGPPTKDEMKAGYHKPQHMTNLMQRRMTLGDTETVKETKNPAADVRKYYSKDPADQGELGAEKERTYLKNKKRKEKVSKVLKKLNRESVEESVKRKISRFINRKKNRKELDYKLRKRAEKTVKGINYSKGDDHIYGEKRKSDNDIRRSAKLRLKHKSGFMRGNKGK